MATDRIPGTPMHRGHGHVTPNPDGSKARCGGPRMCTVCALELAATIEQPTGSPATSSEVTFEVFRTQDGRVFANVNRGGVQLAHLKAGESYTLPAPQSEIGPIPEGCTPADAMRLREANFQLVALFNEIAPVLEMWDEGLDEMDGEDYERGVKAWNDMMAKVRAYK
jgi:hypothetical protein